MSINIVILAGNLTKDPEVKVVNGKSLCEITIAVDRGYGDKKKRVFIDGVAWGKTADNLAKYHKKGSPCAVEGELDLDQWEDKTSGQKRSKHKIAIERVKFLPKGPTTGARSDEEDRPSKPTRQDDNDFSSDEDVPF